MFSAQTDSCPPECRRAGQNRRKNPIPVISKYTFTGNRRSQRRQDDLSRHDYVDRPHKEVMALVAAIAALCALDALLTFYHVGMGASEANPVMNYYLQLGSGWFFLFKALITVPALIVLLLHHNFYYIKKVVSVIGTLYSLVVIYHILLFVFTIVPHN